MYSCFNSALLMLDACLPPAGNGTDGAVYLSLTGDCGQSLEQRLWGTFERGSKDTATLSFPDPGTITKVTLSHRWGGCLVTPQQCGPGVPAWQA
jgi:hypothetical protein